MPSIPAWSLLIARTDLRDARIALDAPAPCIDDESEALLEVERFAFTANNITYALMGDLYWKFFPAPAGFGKVPVWGYARVVHSQLPGLAVGRRVFGYLPCASHLRVRPRADAEGFADETPHRAALPPFYNRYRFAADESDAAEDYRSLLLFGTSFLVDDYIARAGAQRVVFLGASSKTALATAFLLKRRGVDVVAFTASAHLDCVARSGYYDTAVSYDDAATAACAQPQLLVDFSGNARILQRLLRRWPEAGEQCLRVGCTHWQDVDRASDTVGTQFFAPTAAQERMRDWGPAQFAANYARAWDAFLADCPRWLTLHHLRGSDAALETYRDTLAGTVDPHVGRIVHVQ